MFQSIFDGIKPFRNNFFHAAFKTLLLLLAAHQGRNTPLIRSICTPTRNTKKSISALSQGAELIFIQAEVTNRPLKIKQRQT